MSPDPRQLLRRYERGAVTRLLNGVDRASGERSLRDDATAAERPEEVLERPPTVRAAVVRNPFLWIGGAVAVGLGTTLLLRRGRVGTLLAASTGFAWRIAKVFAVRRTVEGLDRWTSQEDQWERRAPGVHEEGSAA